MGCRWKLAAILLVTSLASPAMAAGQVIYTFSGLASGRDTLNQFGLGTTFSDQSFTARFVWSPEVRPALLNRSAFVEEVQGGPYFGLGQNVAAQLTINGATADFGASRSQIFRTNGLGNPSLGLGHDNIAASASNESGFLFSLLYTPLSSTSQDFLTDVDLTAPGSFSNISSPLFTGFFVIDRDISGQSATSGSLQVTDLIVEVTGPIIVAEAVPEPASWALMIAGFGLVGGAARRRRPRASVSFG